jgi:hypothetical protein
MCTMDPTGPLTFPSDLTAKQRTLDTVSYIEIVCYFREHLVAQLL